MNTVRIIKICKNINKNQTEQKNAITEIKNILEEINSRLSDMKEWVRELEDTVMEIIKWDRKEEKKF